MISILKPSRLVAALALLCGLLMAHSSALAQGTPTAVAVPPAIDAPIINVDGQTVGMVHVVEDENGVNFTVTLDAGALPSGEHGIHVHEVGKCDTGGDEPFASAGEHFNPTNQHHGPPNSDTSHAGDLGNLTVADDGSADATITTTTLTLQSGPPTSLFDADGSSLIIHADADDLKTDPSGNSGDRVLCAVLTTSGAATPIASPAASPTP